MAVIIMILKGIGIVLLALLLLLLVLLAVILFLPLRYELYGRYLDGKARMRFRIGGFTGFLRFWCSYEEQEMSMEASAFYGLWRLYPPREKKKKADKQTSQQMQAGNEARDEAEINTSDGDNRENHNAKAQQSTHNTDNYQGISHKKRSRQRKKSSAGHHNTGTNRFSDILAKIRDEGNQRAVSFLIETMLWLLKRVKPTIHNADIDFSLGEPDWTGQATGLISMWPCVYGKRVRITPDFVSEVPYARGEILLTGRIFMIHIIIVAVRVLFNKDCRTLFGK